MLSSACGLRSQSLLLRPTFTTVSDLVIEEAMKYLGTPYRWGGGTPKGFDCAGFTRYIYGKFGVPLAPSAAPQYKAGPSLKLDEISKGDLVFYGGRTGSKKNIGHVGIVTSVDEKGFSFIHSATSTGITVSHSTEPYYQKRYVGACRVVDRVVSNLPSTREEKSDRPVYRQILFVDPPHEQHKVPLAAPQQ